MLLFSYLTTVTRTLGLVIVTVGLFTPSKASAQAIEETTYFSQYWSISQPILAGRKLHSFMVGSLKDALLQYEIYMQDPGQHVGFGFEESQVRETYEDLLRIAKRRVDRRGDGQFDAIVADMNPRSFLARTLPNEATSIAVVYPTPPTSWH